MFPWYKTACLLDGLQIMAWANDPKSYIIQWYSTKKKKKGIEQCHFIIELLEYWSALNLVKVSLVRVSFFFGWT